MCAAQPISLAERLKGKRAAQREQEDAQEFLGYLLDTAHEELLRLKAAYADLLNLQGMPSPASVRLAAASGTESKGGDGEQMLLCSQLSRHGHSWLPRVNALMESACTCRQLAEDCHDSNTVVWIGCGVRLTQNKVSTDCALLCSGRQRASGGGRRRLGQAEAGQQKGHHAGNRRQGSTPLNALLHKSQDNPAMRCLEVLRRAQLSHRRTAICT